jgi:hypothetical protein
VFADATHYWTLNEVSGNNRVVRHLGPGLNSTVIKLFVCAPTR